MISCILLAMPGYMLIPPESTVNIEDLPDINPTLRGVEGLMDTTGFHTQEGMLEEHLKTAEMLIVSGGHLPI